MKDLIIDYNWHNQVSTSEVTDWLSKSGRLNGDTPINRGHFRVDRIICFFASYQSKWDVYEQIAATQEQDAVLIEPLDFAGCADAGNLVENAYKYLLLYLQASKNDSVRLFNKVTVARMYEDLIN